MRLYGRFDTSFVFALIYIDRLLAADSNFAVTDMNVHRLILTCTIVAEKYINDIYYDNKYYASVGGVHVAELNSLEVTLLFALMWRLGVSPEEYDQKEEELRRAFANALSASEATKWIVLEEAVCETSREAACEKNRRYTPSESSMEASTISGSESVSDAPSESSMEASRISDSQSVSESSESMDSCSELGSLAVD
jgi:hypothetical protein